MIAAILSSLWKRVNTYLVFTVSILNCCSSISAFVLNPGGPVSVDRDRPPLLRRKRDSKENLMILTTTVYPTSTSCSSSSSSSSTTCSSLSPTSHKMRIQANVMGVSAYFIGDDDHDGQAGELTTGTVMSREAILESAVLGSVEGFATESLSCVMHEQLPLDLGVDIEQYLLKSLSVELVTIVWQSYCQHHATTRPTASSSSAPDSSTSASPNSASRLEMVTPVAPDKLPSSSSARILLPVLCRCLFHTLSNTVIHVSSEELRHLFF